MKVHDDDWRLGFKLGKEFIYGLERAVKTTDKSSANEVDYQYPIFADMASAGDTGRIIERAQYRHFAIEIREDLSLCPDMVA